MIIIKKVSVKEFTVLTLFVFFLGVVYNIWAPKGLWSITGDFEETVLKEGEISIFDAHREWEKGAFFVDIRTEDSYQDGHIPGAMSMSYFSFDSVIVIAIPMLEKKERVIVYCSGSECNSAEIIYNKMKLMKLNNVKYFKGGYDEWSRVGYPVEKSKEGKIQ